MKFSIVIPAYNNLPLLQRALSSALQQQGVQLEVIVTDDSTMPDIEQYMTTVSDPRLRYVHNQPSLGAVSNWNSGLRMATGEYIILMHHDEALTGTDHLLRLQQHLDAGAEVVVTNFQVTINGRTKLCRYGPWFKRLVLRHPSVLFLVNVIGPCACVAFRRSLYTPFCDDLRWLVDVEWYYRLLLRRRVIYDPTILIHSIYGHKGQITLNIDIMQTFRSDRAILLRRHPQTSVRVMLWLYKALILNTKKLLGRI